MTQILKMSFRTSHVSRVKKGCVCVVRGKENIINSRSLLRVLGLFQMGKPLNYNQINIVGLQT